jgi:hypothetical protein
MPTDSGTDTFAVAVSGSDRLGDSATVTVVGVESGAEALAEADTDTIVIVDTTEDELVISSGTLTNSGRAVYPIINVLGPGQDPYVQNVTTGETWRLDGVVLDDHDLLVANMQARRIMLEGAPVGGRRRGSDWLHLAPGDNDIVAGGRGCGPGFEITLTWDAVA